MLHRLYESCLHVHSVTINPLIIKKTLAFANKNNVWTDENKFNLTGSDGNYIKKRKCESFPNVREKKSVKFGSGSLLMWEMFSGIGLSQLIHLMVK